MGGEGGGSETHEDKPEENKGVWTYSLGPQKKELKVFCNGPLLEYVFS